MQDNMTIGDRIAHTAEIKGINLHRLATLADVPYNTLYSIVQRKSDRVDHYLLRKVSAALGVSLEYLLGNEKAVLAPDLQEKILSSIKDRIMSELSAADPADNYEVFGIADNEAILESIIDRHATITLNQIENAADMLGVSVEYLLSQSEEADIPAGTPAAQQRFMKMEIAFQKLNDEGQEKAIERIKELTEIPRYKRDK